MDVGVEDGLAGNLFTIVDHIDSLSTKCLFETTGQTGYLSKQGLGYLRI